eukprot:13392318-Alexandrium_andersonii.AAC.1
MRCFHWPVGRGAGPVCQARPVAGQLPPALLAWRRRWCGGRPLRCGVRTPPCAGLAGLRAAARQA